MSEDYKNVFIEEVSKSIVPDIATVPKTDGISGGVAITGFIDVEKLIHIRKHCSNYKTLFLEKKLPFSYLIIALDSPGREIE